MTCRGVHFAITKVELNGLLTAGSDKELRSLISDGIEDRWDLNWLVQTDKAWDAIHRCLTDGRLATDNGSYPLSHCILGGKQLYVGDDYIVSLKRQSECADIAAAITRIEIEWMREKYFAIPCQEYGLDLTEEDFQYTWDRFSGLHDLFDRAARGDRHVIFTVDL
jgi:hypothetical protein